MRTITVFIRARDIPLGKFVQRSMGGEEFRLTDAIRIGDVEVPAPAGSVFLVPKNAGNIITASEQDGFIVELTEREIHDYFESFEA